MFYGIELRERVIFFIHSGYSIAETAAQFCISEQTIRALIWRFDKDGTLHPKKVGSPGKQKISKNDVISYVENNQDATLS